MQKFIVYFLLAFFPLNFYSLFQPEISKPMMMSTYQLYEEMELEELVDYTLFHLAMKGHDRLKIPNKDIITLIDFSKPSTEERLYVLDLKNKKLIFSSLVSHGRNSGQLYATDFSNKTGSHKSSLGFYMTGNTYEGGNGQSLILKGLEKGFNDRAKERAIVIHGADYCDSSFAVKNGYLGRSYGCPSLPRELNDVIINTIKDGSLLFIYADNHHYLSKSQLLK